MRNNIYLFLAIFLGTLLLMSNFIKCNMNIQLIIAFIMGFALLKFWGLEYENE